MAGRQKRQFRIELILSIATLILVAALLGFEVGKYCLTGADGLADKVRTSMNQYLSDDQQFRHSSAQVTTITVMRTAENMFEGQATVTASGTTEHQVSVPSGIPSTTSQASST
jgi:hypothetical protein